jgi:hypothetical protein
MEFLHLSEVIKKLAIRHSDLTRRKQWLSCQPIATAPPQRLEQALQYESLLARITELESVLEMLITTLNMEHEQPLKRNRHIDAYLKAR